jgi:hypothetical protein
MSSRRRAVHFPSLVEQMKEDVLPIEDWPTVVGGRCGATELVDWLNGLDLSPMDVRIWYFTDHCTIGNDGPPGSVEFLERARLFGQGGDLDLRRDGEVFRWRYVGKAEHAPDGEALAYLGEAKESPVYCREREALLWGTRENGQDQWFDDRVSGARLTYPVDRSSLSGETEERVKVRFREYTQAGQTVAVWLLGLEAYEEVKNG